MPSTHLGLFYHIVFSTKSRHPYIKESWEARLHRYLGGILSGLGGAAIAIGGVADHIHIEARLKATRCLADVVQEIKANSSGWIHRVIGSPFFGWQDDYGAFTVSSSDIEAVSQYIQGQKEHHRKKSFQEEYLEFLKQSGIEFDERYLW